VNATRKRLMSALRVPVFLNCTEMDCPPTPSSSTRYGARDGTFRTTRISGSFESGIPSEGGLGGMGAGDKLGASEGWVRSAHPRIAKTSDSHNVEPRVVPNPTTDRARAQAASFMVEDLKIEQRQGT